MTKTRWTQIVAWLLTIAGIVLIGLGGMVLFGRFPRAAATQSRLQTVRETGYLRCGIEGGLSGFSVVSGDPVFWKDGLAYFDDAQGFDTDFCRVIAVAVFGTAVDHLYFIPLNVEQRFQAVKDGTIDVLVRNTTCTAGRDIHVGIDFGPVIFHDGQKFLVPVDSDIYTLADLDGKQICVLPGTTSIDNVRTTFDDLGMSYELISERRP
ncbi:MAG: transporter substrate-binding domain-containing protein, partial [Caldilineaceae bacterium]|nr:transporter substrate-binding domain-containing protein [Caldilineaceae bacterium]